MSLAIAGIEPVQPFYAQPGAAPPYAQNAATTQSAGATTLAAETGAAAVVYEPSEGEADQDLTYSNPETKRQPAPQPRLGAEDLALPVPEALPSIALAHVRPAEPDVAPDVSIAGDESVVAATDAVLLPPQPGSERPLAVPSEPQAAQAQAPLVPAAPDAALPAYDRQPPQAGQAEAHAQAVYAAVANANVAGAPLADLPKYA
jgi:hypothetical protein